MLATKIVVAAKVMLVVMIAMVAVAVSDTGSYTDSHFAADK